ncbi:tetraacyldisaccharide 4'-kinase [Paracoccaceae bacterium GXU_MW_L88]
MKRFWQTRGPLARLLFPLGRLYQSATDRRVARGPYERLPVPVISIGNLTVGGTGKTPVTMALAERLIAAGHAPHIVSRGYGGSLAGPVTVDPQRHSAAEVGDEPLMLTGFAPVHIGRDRGPAAALAVKAGADVILLDDAHQNPALAKDLSIIVIDGATGFGNGYGLPAGPLRETVPAGLKRADLAIIMGAQTAPLPPLDMPTLHATLEPLSTGMDWQNLRAIAFAGIGRPAKFFETLKGLGVTLVATHEFPDHAPYSDVILTRLRNEAAQSGAVLVTTEKDIARMTPEQRQGIWPLMVRCKFADEGPLTRELAKLGL